MFSMTYLQFHFIFTLPAIFLLKLVGPRVVSSDLMKAGASLLTITVIAFVYTTPWDNYLVMKGVWGYGADRVIATAGYVPIEEYMFFVLQPILTGLWLFRSIWSQREHADRQPSTKARWAGTAFFLVLSGIGLVMLQYDSSLYMALILVWAAPVLAFQWSYGGHHLWRLRHLWWIGVVSPTLYLCIADRIAIGVGIWHISETYTLGINLLGLPLEEATFFLVTNILVVQGLLLMLHTLKVPALAERPS